ncbi:16S rRNA (guanine(527)-N(7))-methyltransferase RsmG [Halothiobacillus sp.]|uniref:16S rRNA (guanine(527)-N(7))-methyltransferase RsmG n=2 Tax=Halothiobacillus sp. TaxID=1891311 RepID=UPI0026060926|nr:16S rRNA (guanine(527)-N(7))-methyltransferase RsmG [Halothiobacillus sp.]MDD3575990.1 16S rRNA (guanine(527)-N(7))-methyltransferase RsmG [Halothiobacillus sp.]MDY0148133.1 16S rRNA (guanine(527)-N(7))-methyltransferase RsmG [Halothiobacillus sp.]
MIALSSDNEMVMRYAGQIEQGVQTMGQEIAPRSAQRISAYIHLLAKWNRTYNLTAVRNLEDMRVRHVLDALAVRPWVKSAGRLVDVGSGPGIPGILLALADETLGVTLIDSNLKMTRFAEAAVRELAIENVTVLRSRVEEVPASSFDQAISRAFASTADFLRLTDHLVRPGGEWLAMKGRLDEREQQAVADGFICRETIPLSVPALDAARHLLIYQREAQL